MRRWAPYSRGVPEANLLETSATWSRERVQLVDAALAGLIALVTVLLLGSFSTVQTTLIGFGLTVPLAFRRTAPVPAAAAVTFFGLLELGISYAFLPANFAVLVMIYSLAAYAPRWASRAGLITGLVGAGLAAIRYYAQPYVGPPYDVPGYDSTVVFDVPPGVPYPTLFPGLLLAAGAIAVTVVAAWALGSLRRIRLQQVASLKERARLMEVEHLQEIRLATSAERARIAREMHDVVAHSLSVVIAQADGGRYAGRSEPAAALDSLEAIAGTGRQALSDMRSLLGVLRDDGQTTFAPQPDAVAIPGLVADVRASGLDVDLLVDGEPRWLPAGPGLAAYRIVQESLTNVLKHAGPASRAWVTLRWLDDGLDISVIDDGRGASAAMADTVSVAAPDVYETSASHAGSGQGIAGMRERATLYGGQFRAGPQSGGGFAVHSRIPYPRRA